MGVPATLLAWAVAGAGAAGIITPSGPGVPVNLLRIEVHLARPLAGLGPGAVILRDASGRPIPDALLDISVPDRDERTLVVLMQPGRIKHGVGPNVRIGPALHQGEQVSIELRDARLGQPLTRSWHITAPSEQRLVPASWTVRAPPAGSRKALALALDTAINASAAALIAVADQHGKRVAGTPLLAAGETEWRFLPSAPWKPGRYQLRIHPALEDPAGNRVCAAFEERHQSEVRCDADARIDFDIAAH